MNDYTPEQIVRAEDRLRNPTPGSRIEAAANYGVDLNGLIANLRLTPSQRVWKMQATVQLRDSGSFLPNRRRDEEAELLELEALLEATED